MTVSVRGFERPIILALEDAEAAHALAVRADRARQGAADLAVGD